MPKYRVTVNETGRIEWIVKVAREDGSNPLTYVVLGSDDKDALEEARKVMVEKGEGREP